MTDTEPDLRCTACNAMTNNIEPDTNGVCGACVEVSKSIVKLQAMSVLSKVSDLQLFFCLDGDNPAAHLMSRMDKGETVAVLLRVIKKITGITDEEFAEFLADDDDDEPGDDDAPADAPADGERQEATSAA